MFFSDDYSEKKPEALAEILAGCVKRANIPSMVVTMGGERCGLCRPGRHIRHLPGKKSTGKRYDRSRRCVLRRCGKWSDIRKNLRGSGGDWNTSGGVRDHVIRECLSAFRFRRNLELTHKPGKIRYIKNINVKRTCFREYRTYLF